jgi:ATP-dependent DNA helicase RecG
MKKHELITLVNNFTSEKREYEWLEFKQNFHSTEEIGKTISALANGANLHGEACGYLIFGVEDSTRRIVGTSFKPKTHKIGNEDLEHWLLERLDPKIDVRVFEVEYSSNLHLVILQIPASIDRPVRFFHKAYIRILSITRELGNFPDKEAKIWQNRQHNSWEKEIAKSNVSATEIVELLSTQTYFELLHLSYPQNQDGVIERLLLEKIIVKNKIAFDITKMGAILLAKNLKDFDDLERKGVRVILYEGADKTKTIRDHFGTKGYAVGFTALLEWINSQLPANEEIGKALRIDKKMYPEIALRELIANALIHQDFTEKGCPIVEIFSDRIEISNPGLPLIQPERFIDENVSRNEKLADCMRRMGICEEKGSGLDKVILYNEIFQLPAISILNSERRTKITLYSYKTLTALDKKEKINACYQHACLKYVSNDKMTNQSLRERFQIEGKNAAIASRIIKDTLESKKIKEDDPSNTSRKFKKYIPYWA